MARTTTITFDQVAAAANAIKAAGEKPTARRVREALGTGSMATVLRFFQQWQGGGVAPGQDAEEIGEVMLDPAIIKAISTAIAAQVAAAGVEAAQRIAELQGDRQALMQEVERLSADLETVDQDCQTFREQAANLAGKVETLRQENSRQTEEIGRLIQERQAAFTAAEVATAKLKAAEIGTANFERRLAEVSKDLENSREANQARQARLESASRELEIANKARDAAIEKARIAGEEAAELRGMVATMKINGVMPSPAPSTNAKPHPDKTNAARKKNVTPKAKTAKSATLPLEPSNG